MGTNYKPETICIQSGWTPKKGEPRVLPIYQSTTFKYENSDQMGRLFDLEDTGYFYTRLQNPTNDAVAAKITALEGGIAGMLTSSGQAANYYAIFNICEAGDHFICSNSIYGGTFNLFDGISGRFRRRNRSGVSAEYQSRLCRDDFQPVAGGFGY